MLSSSHEPSQGKVPKEQNPFFKQGKTIVLFWLRICFGSNAQIEYGIVEVIVNYRFVTPERHVSFMISIPKIKKRKNKQKKGMGTLGSHPKVERMHGRRRKIIPPKNIPIKSTFYKLPSKI